MTRNQSNNACVCVSVLYMYAIKSTSRVATIYYTMYTITDTVTIL